ncbi:MAG: AtpZ/AtpI family protein [Pseudomonadota bacterium]
MPAPEDPAAKLDDLGRRIEAAKEARRPGERVRQENLSAVSLAWRMVTELVVGVLLGAAIGWGLDSLFGTLPLLLIVMGLLGFAAGVRTMLRSADEIRRREAARTREASDD